MMKSRTSLTWTFVVFCLFIIPPVGIALLLFKLYAEKLFYYKNGKIVRTVGLIIAILGLLYTLIWLFDKSYFYAFGNPSIAIVVILFVAVLGIVGIIVGNRFIKRGNRMELYKNIIEISHETSIDNIAEKIPTSYDNALIDLRFMLNNGYFDGGYIDEKRHEIYIKDYQDNQNQYNNSNRNNYQPRPYTVICKNCGASNTVIPGKDNKCEYCGSPLD